MSNGPEIVPAVLNSAEAAKYIGVSLTTFYDYVANGLINEVRLPKRSEDRKKSESLNAPRRKKQFRRRDLDAFIERYTFQPQEQPRNVGTKIGTGNLLSAGKNRFQRGFWKNASR